MKIPVDVKKSVAFIGCKTTAGEYSLRGTAFLVGRQKHPTETNKVTEVYWVTARHVVERIRALGCRDVWIRTNRVDQTAKWVRTPINSWHSVSDRACDIAVLAADLNEESDQLAVGPDHVLTTEIQEKYNFGPTDDCFIVGLFHFRSGNTRNTPLIRTGTIASLEDEEVVATRLGPMAAHLIECRSIGGLSGSPVYVAPGTERGIFGSNQPYLFGIIHGHYDVRSTQIDDADGTGSLEPDQVNTGIAIVTPVRLLENVLESAASAQRRSQFSIFTSADHESSLGLPLSKR